MANKLTFFHFVAGDCFARRLPLLLAQRLVLLHCAPHLDLQPIDLVANVVHLAIETIVEPEVALLAEAAASHVALAQNFDAVILAEAAVGILLGALQFGLLAADHLQNVALGIVVLGGGPSRENCKISGRCSRLNF